MKEEITIFNSEKNDTGLNSDLYDKNSIVLIRLNTLPSNHMSNEFINEKDCTISCSWIIKNKKEVFESIYNLGREIYNTFYKKKSNEHPLPYYSYVLLDENNDKNKLKNLFNNYVKENGYPYMTETPQFLGIEKLPIPSHAEFLDVCMDFYIIEELRKWIAKIKNNQNVGYKSSKEGTTLTVPVQKFKSLYDIFKPKIMNWVAHTNYPMFDDHYNQEVVLYKLDLGIPFTSAVTKFEQAKLESFTMVLHRTLIYYLLTKYFGRNFSQNSITKSIPIFNRTNDEYRLYTTAFSLTGIAYDYLLNNLTATKTGSTRAICEIPECNNEFEKLTKSNFCGRHDQDEIRKYINHKYYEKRKYNSSHNK